MKPRWYEFIPFYGWIKYFNRYWDATKRNYKEAIIAEWMNFYHTTIFLIITILLIKIFI